MLKILLVHNDYGSAAPSGENQAFAAELALLHAIGPRAARVLTLHNYWLFCPAAIALRNDRVCTDCLNRRSSWPALWHGGYRESRWATLPLAFSVGLRRMLGTWTRHVDAFIALTDFQRDRMIAAGLPAELVHVKPNFYPGNPTPVPWAARRPSVVFAGRLTAAKGVMALRPQRRRVRASES